MLFVLVLYKKYNSGEGVLLLLIIEICMNGYYVDVLMDFHQMLLIVMQKNINYDMEF